MRILYHHRTASRDGQAVHIDEMIHALRELGHEVFVAAPRMRDVGAQAGGVTMGTRVSWVHRLRALLPKAVYEVLELGYSIPAWWRLRRVAAACKPDLIYERYNLHMLAGTWVARQRGVPLFIEVNAPLAEERGAHGGLGLPALARWAEDRVWRAADRVFTVTQVLGQRIAARGVHRDRIVVTPNGINRPHFEAAPLPRQAKATLGWPDALVLGFTGFVREWHGVDRVIRWLACDAAPAHARLLVVGDGPARPALEALASELQLNDRVRFTGLVHRDAVPALVAAFDIALQPSVVDYASPLKLFEYLALGKAVVAPAQPNIQEVLQHAHNALLFPPGDDTALHGCLQQLADNPALRTQLGEAARRTIDERGLTWLHNARRVEHEARTVNGSTEQMTLKTGARA